MPKKSGDITKSANQLQLLNVRQEIASYNNKDDIVNLLKDIFQVDECKRPSAKDLLHKYQSWFIRHGALR